MTSHRIVTDEKDVSWTEVAMLFAAVGWKGRSPDDVRAAFACSRFKAFAFAGTDLVGFGRTIDDGKFYATLVDVVVSPAHQGTGVGRAIVENLQERLQNFLVVTLTAAPPVQDFYERLGWRTVTTGMMLPRSPEQARLNDTEPQRDDEIAITSPAVAVLGTLRFPPDRIQDVLPHLQRLVTATNEHDGCIAYDVALDPFDPGLIRFTELWPDQATLDRHLKAPHIEPWREAVRACGVLARSFTVHEVSSSRAL